MLFWEWLWTLLWFGGLAIFSALSVVITVQGARDLRALLQGLRAEVPPARDDSREDQRTIDRSEAN
jgi:hypothetical protein